MAHDCLVKALKIRKFDSSRKAIKAGRTPVAGLRMLARYLYLYMLKIWKPPSTRVAEST